MANQYHARTNANIQALVNAIVTAVGNGFQVDFSYAPGFTLTLQVMDDGSTLAITAKSDAGVDTGNPNGFGVAGGGRNNPFYAPDSGPGVQNASTHFTTGPAFVVDGSIIPG